MTLLILEFVNGKLVTVDLYILPNKMIIVLREVDSAEEKLTKCQVF